MAETLYVSNQVVNGRYQFTLLESRIMAEITEALNSFNLDKLKQTVKEKVWGSDEGVSVYSVNHSGVIIEIPYKKMLKGKDRNYTPLKKAAHSLIGKHITLADGKTIPYVIGVTAYKWDDTGSIGAPGMLHIEISRAAVPFFAGLKKSYTSTGKNIALNSSSKYSPRMYDLLGQFSDVSDFRIEEISELRNKLGVPEGKLTGWKDFRKRVLEACQSDLADTPRAFTWDIPVGSKTGANGKQITRIKLVLTKSNRKGKQVEKSGSAIHKLELFWSKLADKSSKVASTPGTLSLATSLKPIIDIMLSNRKAKIAIRIRRLSGDSFLHESPRIRPLRQSRPGTDFKRHSRTRTSRR